MQGAIAGGAFAPIARGVGLGAQKVGQMLQSSAPVATNQANLLAARANGYVVPPSQVDPSVKNRLMEGLAGKLTTAQNASAKNASITNGLAAQELGLAKGTQITPDVLTSIRQTAGQAYEAVASTGQITTTPTYSKALDALVSKAKQASSGFPNAKANPLIAEIESLRSTGFDASSAVAKISELRANADVAYRAGDNELGKALKGGAKALEDAIDTHLQQIGAPADMLNGFRDARQLIAKTYTVQKALNPATGTVNAQKLGSQLAAGKPLSGGMRDAAMFAQAFPKAAQPLERMGSLPQISPLDFVAGGGLAAGLGNPMLLAAPLARPVARNYLLSNFAQNRLGAPSSNMLAQNLGRATPLASRAVPVLAAQ